MRTDLFLLCATFEGTAPQASHQPFDKFSLPQKNRMATQVLCQIAREHFSFLSYDLLNSETEKWRWRRLHCPGAVADPVSSAPLSAQYPQPLSPSLVARRQEVSHSNCSQLTILKSVRVPHLGRLHVTMAKEVAHFKNRCPHVEQS
jgi:hypothetical protein